MSVYYAVPTPLSLATLSHTYSAVIGHTEDSIVTV